MNNHTNELLDLIVDCANEVFVSRPEEKFLNLLYDIDYEEFSLQTNFGRFLCSSKHKDYNRCALLLARELFVLIERERDNTALQFAGVLAKNLQTVNKLSGRELIRSSLISQNWENHVFNVRVELEKVKYAMEPYLFLLSEEKQLQQILEKLRKAILNYESLLTKQQ